MIYNLFINPAKFSGAEKYLQIALTRIHLSVIFRRVFMLLTDNNFNT